MTSSTSITAEREPWQRDCPVCTYDLQGLPLGRACPECGFQMDDDTVVLYGERHGYMPMWVAAALFTYGGFHVMVIATASPTMGGFFMRNRTLAFIAGFLLLGLAAWTVYRGIHNRRLHRTEGGRTQVIVAERGVSRRQGPGAPDWLSWRWIKRYQLRRYYRWAFTWKKPLPTSWILTFSSGPIFDPMRQTGSTPNVMGHGTVYVTVIFNATADEAERLRGAIERHFQASRAAVATADVADGGES